MNLSVVLVLIFVPSLFASLDHLSYRIVKRQVEDDDLEGSADGKPTRADDDNSPDDGAGDPILEGPSPTTEAPPTATVPPVLTSDSEQAPPPAPPTTSEVDAEVPTEPPAVPPAEVEVARIPQEETPPSPVTPSPEQPITATVTTALAPPEPTPPLSQPPAPIQERAETEAPPPATLAENATPAQDETEQAYPARAPPPVPHAPRRIGGAHVPERFDGEGDDEEPRAPNSNSTDSDFSIDDGKNQTVTLPTTSSGSDKPESTTNLEPISDQQPPTNDSLIPAPGSNSNGTEVAPSGIDTKPGQGIAASTGADGADAPESLETVDSKKSDSWSIIPVDELSLLIFILLCLILIVILLVCCFILQHMTHWAIIRVDQSHGQTYANVCPVKSDPEQGMAKYTIEPDDKEGAIELTSFSKCPAPSTPKTFTLEQSRKAEVHRSTVEVILTGEPSPKPTSASKPIDIATINDSRLYPVQTHRPTSDPWIRDVLKKIENEDAQQPEPTLLKTFTRPPNPSIVYPERDVPTKPFVTKVSVNSISSTTKKTVTETETVETINGSRLNVDKTMGGSHSGSRKSFDDLSGDELDDYLDNSDFPV